MPVGRGAGAVPAACGGAMGALHMGASVSGIGGQCGGMWANSLVYLMVFAWLNHAPLQSNSRGRCGCIQGRYGHGVMAV